MQVPLQVERHAVVTGAIIGTKNSNVRDICLLRCNVAREKRREKRVTGLILISRVAVHAGLMREFGARHPMRIEGMLDPGGGMQRIRSLICRIDERARATIPRTGETDQKSV